MKKLILLLAFLMILLCGVFSDPHLGDEVVHFRLARYIYEQNSWPVFDPLNQSFSSQKFFYIDPMLWQTFLAGLWRITGGVSKIVAQFYQASYFLILILAIYLFTKEIYDEKIAFYSALVTATIPVVPALSIILHTDIPVTALTFACLLFLVKRKYFIAGLIGGMAFLTKRTIYLFSPGLIIFLLFYLKGNLKNKISSVLSFFIPLALIASVGYLHRSIIDKVLIMTIDQTATLYAPPDKAFFLKDMFNLKQSFLKAPFFIGVSFIVSFLAYFLNKNYSKKDNIIWISIVGFFVIYFNFTKDLSIRYSLIIIPLLSVIAAIGLSNMKSKKLKSAIIIICLLQFVFSSIYTMLNRRIPKELMATYNYIKLNTAADSRIMCSRPDLQLYSERKTMWNNYLALKEMPYLFWFASSREMLNIFEKYKIDYLLVEKDRVYDDTNTQHQLGWPSSFVKRMYNYDCLKLILENKYIALWQVKR